jgi:hypothetical protein
VKDQKLIVLKAHLGTGKTEAVMRLIQEKNYQKVLYLSFRKTFSQSLAARFSPLGNVLLYSDQRGSLYHHQGENHHRVIVCQIEALTRYMDTPDLLVVDEWESVLSQMNGQYALHTTDVVDALRRVFQASQQTILMDGFLQETSIQLFNHITGNETMAIQQNLYQPFSDHKANVLLSSQHNENVKTIVLKLKDVYTKGGKSCAFITSNA